MNNFTSTDSLTNMDERIERVVNRMPSMADWGKGNGQRAGSLSHLPLDGQDAGAIALSIFVFGIGAWRDIAKVTGIDEVRMLHAIRSPLFAWMPFNLD